MQNHVCLYMGWTWKERIVDGKRKSCEWHQLSK